MSAQGLIVFDLDGTLFDHASSARPALRSWLGWLGAADEELPRLESAWFEIEERHLASGGSLEVPLQELRRRRLREFLPLLGHAVVESRLDDLFADYLSRYESQWQPYPEALAALIAIRSAGYATAVLTNGDQQQQEAKVAATGLAHLCGPVLASRALGVSKPDRRAYEAVLSRLDTPPDRAVMVGDNYDLDVVAARAAGLRAIHVDRAGAHPTPDLERVQTLDGVLGLLEVQLSGDGSCGVSR